MIQKADGYSNKYVIKDRVMASEMQSLLRSYLNAKNFHSIICNYNTCKQLNVQPGNSFITINNKVEDGVFYINRIG